MGGAPLRPKAKKSALHYKQHRFFVQWAPVPLVKRK